MKALVFNGNGVGIKGLNGIEKALKNADIEYIKSSTINTDKLKGITVLILPGGNKARTLYLNNPNIKVDDIKKAQKTGLIVIAICSGGYISVNQVDDLYKAWGLAPNVNAKNYEHEGPLNIYFTPEGEKLFNRKGTIKITHYNGPAMYIPTEKSAVILATYPAGTYVGYAAIIKDENTFIFGPHPELEPFYPDLIVKSLKNH